MAEVPTLAQKEDVGVFLPFLPQWQAFAYGSGVALVVVLLVCLPLDPKVESLNLARTIDF
jgi:hypothetical protein